jgi:hypothetical protein
VDIKADLFEGSFEILADFLGENIGVGETIGFFAALLASRSIASRLRASEISISLRNLYMAYVVQGMTRDTTSAAA